MRATFLLASLLLAFASSGTGFRFVRMRRYFTSCGVPLGRFFDGKNDVSGSVYAVDDRHLLVRRFNYDGKDAGAVFSAGKEFNEIGTEESVVRFRKMNETEMMPPELPAMKSVDLILNMNDDVPKMRFLAVWSRIDEKSMGRVGIPTGMRVPKPRVISEFHRFAHDLRSGNITILDRKTFLIPDLYYDGLGPDAYFRVGTGPEPDASIKNPPGMKIPNERGSYDVLSAYTGQTITLRLPGDLTVNDIDWLAMWCDEFQHNFGHVSIPKDLDDVPPFFGQNPWPQN